MAKSRRSPVRKYHDRVAPRYDHSYDDAFWQWHDALTWDYIKPHLPRDVSVDTADLGCGTGKWGAKLIESGYRVTCADISPRMLEQARMKIGAGPGGARATFVEADLLDLSALPRCRFAFALALGDPIGCTAAPRTALRQIHRILRDDGVLIATFDNRLAAMDFYVERGDPKALARFLRDGRTHWLTRDRAERFPIVTYTPRGLVRLVESAGFAVVDLVGKTVLPMRHYREQLETPAQRRAWMNIEKKLARDPDALARASHLQIICRVTNHRNPDG